MCTHWYMYNSDQIPINAQIQRFPTRNTVYSWQPQLLPHRCKDKLRQIRMSTDLSRQGARNHHWLAAVQAAIVTKAPRDRRLLSTCPAKEYIGGGIEDLIKATSEVFGVYSGLAFYFNRVVFNPPNTRGTQPASRVSGVAYLLHTVRG